MSQQQQQPQPETIHYNHEDADKTTMLLFQDQQQQPVFVHHNHEDEDKSSSLLSLHPEELYEDVAESHSTPTTAAPSYQITRLLLLGVPVVIAVVLLLSLVLNNSNTTPTHNATATSWLLPQRDRQLYLRVFSFSISLS